MLIFGPRVLLRVNSSGKVGVPARGTDCASFVGAGTIPNRETLLTSIPYRFSSGGRAFHTGTQPLGSRELRLAVLSGRFSQTVVPSDQRKGYDFDVGVVILSTSHNGVTPAFDFRRFRPSRVGMTWEIGFMGIHRPDSIAFG